MIKNSKPEKIGDVLKTIIKDWDAGRETGEKPADVIKKVVPAQILKHIKIQNKFKDKLIINVEDHNWLYEVSKYKERLLKAFCEKEADFKINPTHSSGAIDSRGRIAPPSYSHSKLRGFQRNGGIKEIFFKVGRIK